MNEDNSSLGGGYLTNHMRSLPQSQHSKVTSLVKRKTSDIDEDDLQYSQSSATHFFQLDGGFINQKEQQQSSSQQPTMAIDMNFINDINNECNYLITKFNHNLNDTQHSKKQSSGDPSRRKSNFDQHKERTAKHKDDDHLSSILNEEKSYKSVVPQLLNSKTMAREGPNKSESTQQIDLVGNFGQDPFGGGMHTELHSNQQMQTLAMINLSGLPSMKSNAPSRMAGDAASTYEVQSAGNNGIESDMIQSQQVESQIARAEGRIIEDGSTKFALLSNSNKGDPRQIASGFSMSEKDSPSITPQQNNNHQHYFMSQPSDRENQEQQASLSQPSEQKLQHSNRLTFRQDDNNQANFNSHTGASQYHQTDSMQPMDQAHFDLQNFNAFNQQIPADEDDQDDQDDDDSDDFERHPDNEDDSNSHQEEDQYQLKVQITDNLQPPQSLFSQTGLLTNKTPQSHSKYQNQENDDEPKQQLLSERRYQGQDDEEFEREESEIERDNPDEEEQEGFHTQEQIMMSNRKSPTKLETPQGLDQPMTDELIFNRLPKNFFVNDEPEPGIPQDLNFMMSSIQQMRTDFLGYMMNESNIQDKLDEISNILEPEKFIMKHLGGQGESILFEQEITPQVNNKDDDDEPYMTQTSPSKHRSDSQRQSLTEAVLENLTKKSNIEELEDKMKKPLPQKNEPIEEEDQEESPEKEQNPFIKEGSKHENKLQQNSMIRSQQSSPPGSNKKLKSSKMLKSSTSDMYSNPGRHMKMADYFKQNNGNGIVDVVDDDEPSLNEEQKAQLIEKLEQQILGNIDINFVFQKGDGLRHGLIDHERAFKIMKKIKDLATDQVDQGKKEIDYKEIVRYLQEEDNSPNKYQSENDYFQANQQKVINPIDEQSKSQIFEMNSHEDQWVQVVDFMRKNPKLLLQMLPDNSDDEPQKVLHSQQRGKLHSAEDAKKWSKLQALSKTFLLNRNDGGKKEFIDAIDQYQLKQLSPKNLIMKENQRKQVKVKSVTQNQRRINTMKKLSQGANYQSDKDSSAINAAQSDSDYQPRDSIATSVATMKPASQSRQIQFYKQFQYTSANFAKGVYANAPFAENDRFQQDRALIQSQQQATRTQNYRVNQKKKSLSSMGGGGIDTTTMGTTATGMITNLNNYISNQREYQAASQNNTITQDDNHHGSSSAMKEYKDAVQAQSKRPITANAAIKNPSYMQPVLQARQDSFDYKANRVGRQPIGRQRINLLKIQNDKGFEVVSEFANNSQHAQSSLGNYQEKTLNQSDIMNSTAAINLSMNIGPSKKTQQFIDKFAPNLKDNSNYPKFVSRVRRQTQQPPDINYNSVQPQSQLRMASSESVNSSYQNLNQLRKRRLDKQQIMNEKLNQSAVSLKDTSQQPYEMNYDQTQTTQFPKFVKRQVTSQSQSSRKESFSSHTPATASGIRNQNYVQAPKFIQPHTHQHRMMMSPMSNGQSERQHFTQAASAYQNDDNQSQISRQDSEATAFQGSKFIKKTSGNGINQPIIDWAFTPLFQEVLQDESEFNKGQDLSIYVEKEVDYVIEMMKNKYKDFKRSEIMRPFFLKAQQTIKNIYCEQSLPEVFYEKLIGQKYKEITIENTMKLLIRCKLALHARGLIVEILSNLINYELQAVDFKRLIDTKDNYRVSLNDFQSLQETGSKVSENGQELIMKIKKLRAVHKQYKTPFIFKKKDYVNYVKNEIQEVKKLLSVFRVEDQKNLNTQSLKQLNKIDERMSKNIIKGGSLTLQQIRLLNAQQAFQVLPWNFKAHLLKRDVQNLEAPVNLQKYLPLPTYVGLFKDYAESLQSNDFSGLSQIVEPSMAKRIGPLMEKVHKEIEMNGYEFRIENQRKGLDETEFFLYNVENYFLLGFDADRTKVHIPDQYNIQHDQEFFFQQPTLVKGKNEIQIQEKSLKATQIINTVDFNPKSRGLLMMRLHFLVHSYLNLYIYCPKTEQHFLGHPVQQRNMAHKQTHLVTIDKYIGKIYAGDIMMKAKEQQEQQAIEYFENDDGLFISQFDSFMAEGNPIVKLSEAERY